MKKVWKWVIGILVVLVIVAALVGGAFLLRSHFVNITSSARLNLPGQIPGKGPGLRGGPEGFPGMRPFGNNNWGGHGMYMRGPGMMGFGRRMPFGGFFGGLICLGFLALIVLGVIWLVVRLRKPVAVAVPFASIGPVTPAAPVGQVHACPRCGEPVQEGWKHCPNCGKRQ
jgi:hypothetical protein